MSSGGENFEPATQQSLKGTPKTVRWFHGDSKHGVTGMTAAGDHRSVSDSLETLIYKADKKTANVTEHEVAPIETDVNGAGKGFDWRSPGLMLSTYLTGLAAAVGQHFFYASLEGDFVGDMDNQQRVLRYGTTFAFITQVSLAASVSIAATQCLWRSLRRANLELSVIDAAFDSHTTIFSFLNIRLLAKLKVASSLALIAWCLPIASLITPATLSVELVLRQRAIMANVPSLNISNADQAHRYAYATSTQNAENPRLRSFVRPRTILTRLAAAAGTTGEILSIVPPFTNASYGVQFFGPVVKCKDANETLSKHIHAAVERNKITKGSSIMQVANKYFSMVPDLSDAGLTANAGVVQMANHTDTKGAARGSNQLWLGFQRYVVGSDGDAVLRPHQLQCQLYNTSYEVGLSFVQGVQSVELKNGLTPLNLIEYPNGPSESDQAQINMAYTSFMWVLSDQLTGSIAFYTNSSAKSSSENDIWSEITSGIQNTALIGSSDLQAFFDYNRVLYPSKKGTSSGKVSDQRAADIALAKNRTLDILIEELSSNITLSLMSSNLLSPSVLTNVTTSERVNVYAYRAKNLFLAYGIALTVALTAIVLGTLAYISNGVSHNNSFSSIVRATRNLELSRLVDPRAPASAAKTIDKRKGQMVLRLRDDGFVICQK